MPYIKVDLNKIGTYSTDIGRIRSNVQRIKQDFSYIGSALDWDVKLSSNINRRISSITEELSTEAGSMGKMQSFLTVAKEKYAALDSAKKESKVQMSTMTTTAAVSVGAAKINAAFPSILDGAEFLGELAPAANLLNKLRKAGFLNSGFQVKKVGDYLHVFGKNKSWLGMKNSPLKDLAGRKYRIGSKTEVIKGVSSWCKDLPLGTRFSSAMKFQLQGFGKDVFGSKSSILGYVATGMTTISNLVGNVQNGASTSKIIADATTDVAKGLGSMAASAACAKVGAALGTLIPIPVVGTVVGGVLGGFVGGLIYDGLVDGIKIGGKSVAGWVSHGLEKAGDFVGDAVKSGAKAVADVAKTVGNSVKNVAKSIGDGAKKAAEGVKNFFKKLF